MHSRRLVLAIELRRPVDVVTASIWSRKTVLTKQKKGSRSNLRTDALRASIQDSWSESERNRRRREAVILQDVLLGLVELTNFDKPECKSVHNRELAGTY
jgi:hypothetical protein